MNWNPVRPVLEQCLRTPDRLALFADGIELSYADLGGRAARLAAALASAAAADRLDTVKLALAQHLGNTQPHDDVSLMLVTC